MEPGATTSILYQLGAGNRGAEDGGRTESGEVPDNFCGSWSNQSALPRLVRGHNSVLCLSATAKDCWDGHGGERREVQPGKNRVDRPYRSSLTSLIHSLIQEMFIKYYSVPKTFWGPGAFKLRGTDLKTSIYVNGLM